MKKVLNITLLVGGILLLYVGYDEYNSLGSELGKAFGSSGSTEGIWMMIGGTAATIGGLVGLLKEKPR